MTVNVSKCVAYLRSIGIEVSEAQADAWCVQEKDCRERRRAHNREVKRSCGHFRTFETRVISAERGDETCTVCAECRRYIARRPTAPRPRPRGDGGEPLPVERSA